MNNQATLESNCSVNAIKRLVSSRFSLANSSSSLSKIKASQLPFITEVKSKLQNGDFKYETSSCPCGGEGDIIISEIDRYGLPLNSVLCLSCGTLRISPYLTQESLDDFYTNFYQKMYGRTLEIESYLQKQKKYGEKVLAVVQPFLKPGSWVCEVGCGAGGALKVFQDKGYQVAGCDYSAELIEQGRQMGIANLYQGSFADIQANLHGIKADLIYLYKVFEHLSDPISFLEDCKRYLAQKGRILIIVPDVSHIDSCPSPGGDLLKFLHIAHKFNFSFEGIRRLCKRAGYSASKLTLDPQLENWWAKPDLWVQMTLESDTPSEEMSKEFDEVAGINMLKYLEKTEKYYSLGLCKGQLLSKFNGLPIRILLKLQKWMG